ncbi:MAG: feruloyl-CoA synthetase [Pseudooceanicola sp.]|nr:feruloyl-CoA synthetase [Pseudooceanicola sp.]
MAELANYRPHYVTREDRADGTILLRSGYELSEFVEKTSDWLHRWAELRPDTVFLAERDGAGWREVTYAAALAEVRAIAGGLLAQGLGPDTPILVISGNGVDHGLLTLAAQYVGIPIVPVAEQYSLIPGAHAQLRHVLGLIDPRMVFAVDGSRFADALAMPEMEGRLLVTSRNTGAGQTAFADLRGDTAGVDDAAAKVGPDTVAKILMTSGSTSSPKGVLTTHRMMCANQAQLADALPFVRENPPRLVDWLPWNHVFGGSHNFNMVLANGGSLYIDEGKPAKGLVDTSIENNAMIGGTISFNVPVGFAMLRDAMRENETLRQSYFRDLDMIFYAGASLPQDVWADLESMAREVRSDVPLMTSSWGLTETAPACIIQHERIDRSGIVGVPMTGTTIKMIPDDDNRYEIRVKGPNIMPGYFNDPDKTRDAFDEEGFFVTGDAMGFVDPDDMNKGLRFDGRISEDFKLTTGTWVRAAQLRLDLLVALAPLVADLVITGEGRDQVGLLIVPGPGLAAHVAAGNDGAGAVVSEAVREALAPRLTALASKAAGSSMRVTRAIVLAEPPSMAEGEITAKGNLNFRKILTRRRALLDRLYDDADPAVIRS